MSKASEWAIKHNQRERDELVFTFPDQHVKAYVDGNGDLTLHRLRAEWSIFTPEQALAFALWIQETFGE